MSTDHYLPLERERERERGVLHSYLYLIPAGARRPQRGAEGEEKN
jgi:hypothetical protein